jgi:hypothetical protein
VRNRALTGKQYFELFITEKPSCYVPQRLCGICLWADGQIDRKFALVSEVNKKVKGKVFPVLN